MPRTREDEEEHLLKKLNRLKRKISRRLRHHDDDGDLTPGINSDYSEISEEDEAMDVLDATDLASVADNATNEANYGGDVDQSLLEILGPVPERNYSPKIHEEIASRWQTLLKNGLQQGVKDDIISKYLPPENLQQLAVPEVNPEMATATSDRNKKINIIINGNQRSLSAAITALSSSINMLLTSKASIQQQKPVLINNINNAAKLLCGMFHTATMDRRRLILTSVDKDTRDVLLKTEPTNYLFGDNLMEKIRAAKNVANTGRVMRASQPRPRPSGPWVGPPRTAPRVVANQLKHQQRGGVRPQALRRPQGAARQGPAPKQLNQQWRRQ